MEKASTLSTFILGDFWTKFGLQHLERCWWIFESSAKLRCVSKGTIFSQINPIRFFIPQPTNFR